MSALWRNRDFVLLQAGQLLSDTGGQAASIAYPLLVLALTHSALDAGLVGFARTGAQVVMFLPAGLAADRWPRRMLMCGADAFRLGVVAFLGIALAVGRPALALIAALAASESAATAFFTSAQAGALRAVVPTNQLPAAAGAQTGRQAAVGLAGPPAGGALFGVARALPFLLDAGSYLLSTASLLAMRVRFQQDRSPDQTPLRRRVGEGFAFIWSQPYLRTSALLFGLGNLVGPGILLCLIVIGRRQGLSAPEVSALVAVSGASILVGSLVAPRLVRTMRPRAVLLLELWSATATAAFLVWPNAYVLVAGMVPTSLVIPASNSVVHGYRIAVTPDRLLGRSESARALISLGISPLGPLLAGVFLEISNRAAVAFFTGAALTLAVWGTASPSIRHAPRLQEADLVR